MSTKDSEGVPSVSSLNTTTSLPLALFVLVSTNTLRPSSPATANAVARNTAASIPPARHRLIFKVLFSFIGLEFALHRWRQELTRNSGRRSPDKARGPRMEAHILLETSWFLLPFCRSVRVGCRRAGPKPGHSRTGDFKFLKAHRGYRRLAPLLNQLALPRTLWNCHFPFANYVAWGTKIPLKVWEEFSSRTKHGFQ